MQITLFLFVVDILVFCSQTPVTAEGFNYHNLSAVM